MRKKDGPLRMCIEYDQLNEVNFFTSFRVLTSSQKLILDQATIALKLGNVMFRRYFLEPDMGIMKFGHVF